MLLLKLHPASRCDAVAAIDVTVERDGANGLRLRYQVTGALGDLRLPPEAPPARVDALWRSTCFEAFVREGEGPAYFEFNFASSTAWAAYRFAAYRRDRENVGEIAPPAIVVRREPRVLQLETELRALRLAENARWRIGLSAVIEETNGRLSYWALTHPPGKPDFHHPDCFALELEPASRA